MTGKRSKPSLPAEPPDGGWGWIVALSSNLTLTTVLLNRAMGVFFNEWMDCFEASATAAGIVGSVQMASFLFMGPVGGFLCRKIGHRKLAIISGGMTFSSLLVASQAKTMIHLILAFGALGGTSMGFAYVSASTVISLYFKKRFATANGISNSGNAIAMILQPIIARVLIDSYGWNGALFVFAAITANVCIFGMLFRPVRRAKKRWYRAVGHENLSDSMDHDLREVTCKTQVGEEFVQTSSEHTELHSPRESHRKLSTSSRSLDEKDDKHRLEASNKKHDSISTSSHSSKDDSESFKNLSTDNYKLYTDMLNPEDSIQLNLNGVLKDISKPGTKSKAVLCSQTTETVELSPNLKQRRPTKASVYLSHFARGSGLHLLKTKYRFNLFCLSQILQGMCFASMYTYIVPVAIAKDVPKLDAALLLSLGGVGSLVGRLLTGPIIDHNVIGILKLDFFICLTCGITVAVCPVIQSYAGLVVITTVFGLASGMYKGLQLLLIRMFIGASEHLSTAWGIYMPYLGIGYFIAPIFVGWLRDQRGDYDLPFYITGSLFALASFHVFMLPYLSRLERKHRPENAEKDSALVAMKTMTSSVAIRNSVESLSTI